MWKNEPKLEFFADQMTINFKMLDSFMKNQVPRDMKNNLIVTPKRNGMRRGEAEVLEKVSAPL